MRSLRTLILLLMLALLATSAWAQEPDADGDGIPDSADFCWLDAGTAEFSGCTAETFPDFDGDGVGDPVDTCVDRAGDANNSGCPAGVIPDLDLDGVPDAQDACPREPGTAENGGCPPDTDGDGIPDAGDACPNEAGDGGNLGCAAGTTPPDRDGDSVPDLLDACPDAAGLPELGGCADADGDGVPDTFDNCSNEAGQSDLFGCSPVTTVTLPAGTVAISAENAGSMAEVGRLVVGAPRFDVAGGVLALRASDNLLTYDLNAATLAPIVTVNTGWSGYPVAISSDGRFIATLEFPPDFSTPPFAQVRDGTTGAPLYPLTSQPNNTGEQFGIGALAFNPVLPLLAASETTGGGFVDAAGTPVVLWDVTNNRSAGQLDHPNIVTNLSFSGNGAYLATDTADGDSMIVTVWDVGTQAQVTTFDTHSPQHFIGTPLAMNADGLRVAVGHPDGSLSVWLIVPQQNRAGEAYRIGLFNAAAQEVVSAVAYSPDGSVIAVAGGVPFSGGLTGEEQFPIFLVDGGTGAVFARLEGHDSLIRDLKFTHDGRFLISAGDSTVKFWGVGG